MSSIRRNLLVALLAALAAAGLIAALATYAAARDEIDTLLQKTLLRHERDDDRSVYPAVERALGTADPIAASASRKLSSTGRNVSIALPTE